MKNKSGKKQPKNFSITPIGYIERLHGKVQISILPQFILGLKGLEGFGHAQVFWWFDQFDDPQSRETTRFDKMPFEAPSLGVFACRAPMRPNPIGLSTVRILQVDQEQGIVTISEIDAYEKTPVLDIKGYLPSYDRVRNVRVPQWAEDWPQWLPEKGIGLENQQ
jgi:tRNA-Thr(GGU) m(6)t(6)A37 methyltransferase TsaA